METATQTALALDYLVPHKVNGLFRPDEVGSILDFDRSKIYDLGVEGRLEVHRDPAKEKSHLRITRRSVVGYLAATAQYDPADFEGVILNLASTLTPDRRRALAQRLLA